MTKNLKHIAGGALAAALSLSAAHATVLTVNAGGSSLAAPTYIAEFNVYTAAHPSLKFSFEAVGSGKGQAAFLNNDITQFQNVPAGTLTYGTIVGTTVHIGASDAFLVSSQLTNPATGSYAKSGTSGPLIQIPTFGTPVTFAYNESAVQAANQQLTDAQICGVFSGKITDWHTLAAGVPAKTTIKVVYRADGSGTSFLLTNHLKAVCTSANSNFTTKQLGSMPTTSFASLFTTVPSNFTGESGSANVASELLAVSGGIGYLSPDYTSIAPNSANTTSLKVAKVVNAANGTAYLPTVQNTEAALTNPNQSLSTNPTPPATKTAAMDPLNWVPAVPVTKSGYPVVGYTTIDVSSCYSNTTIGSAIVAFLTAHFSAANYKTIITNNGFAPLANTSAVQYVAAVKNTFLTNSSGYGLNIDNKTSCASYAGR